MKKIIKILFILSIVIVVDVNALSKSDLTVLDLDSIRTADKPKNYTSVQGGATTDKYVITLFINEHEDTDGITAISLFDKNTLKKVELADNPIKRYGFKHSNDATYNSLTNELAVLSGRSVDFLDLTDDHFELTRSIELNKYYHGLGYDEENNQYVLSRTIKDGTLFEIRDADFNIIRTFKLETNLTKQSLTVYQGNIYYVCYESGRINKYEKVYDGLLKRKENLIYVYNLEGEKQTIYYIPYDYKEIIFGEIENISFNNGKMLVQFNHANKAGYFTPEYRHEINSIISVKVTKQNDKDYEYALYDEEDNELTRVRSDNAQITFYLRHDKEGLYKYSIKRVHIGKKKKEKIDENSIVNEEIQTTEKNLEVEIYYDPVVNRLRSKTNSNELILYNNKLYTEDELHLTDDTSQKIEKVEE